MRRKSPPRVEGPYLERGKWRIVVVGAPRKADINQRVQVPSVETGTKRGEPCAVTRGDPHGTESCVGCREAVCEA